MKWYFLAAVAALAIVTPAQAQLTNITPDTAPGLSLGTTVNQSGTTFTIDGGTTAGTNLFHSFNTFDLGAGDTAAWIYSAGDSASITNVVNRITGGTPSSIFGTIDSTAIPYADFYFINPAGIVFSGQDAQVNVPAAAYFSTASEMHFADGKTFAVATPSGSTLSVAAPQAFGFIGNEGDILVSSIENIDDTPFLAQAGKLGLSAANITFDNGFIGGNELWLTAVGSGPNEVALDGVSAGLAAGRIDMAYSWLQTWAADCYDFCLGAEGYISLNAGSALLYLTGVVADFDSTTDDGGTSFIRIVGNNSLELSSSFILADGYGTAAAGDIFLASSGAVSIFDTLVLAYTQGTGEAGEIGVVGSEVSIDRSMIASESYGSGNGGSVNIAAGGRIGITGESSINTTAYDSGNAGSVLLEAATIDIDSSLVSSDSYGAGNSGSVRVAADNLSINASLITTDSFDTGDAGSIALDTGELTVSDSRVSSTTNWTGTGGSVDVSARSATISASEFSSLSNGPGNAGSVALDIEGRLAASNSIFSSASTYEGDAGTVTLAAGEALLDDSLLNTSTEGSGDAGEIAVDVGQLELNDSRIVSFSMPFASGDAGTVTISADRMTINGARAYVATSTFGDGDAGNIVIDVDELSVINGGAIGSRSVGDATGDAGSLAISADTLLLDAGLIDVSTFTAGDGGSIAIDAASLTLLNASKIASESSGSGSSGSIVVRSDAILIADGSRISTNSALGPAGNITFDMAPGSLLTLEGAGEPGVIETSSGPGTGGVITIASPLAIISNGGSILALGEQGGANVLIDANYFIASSDRPNLVQVDGNLTFSNAIYDVSAGTADADLDMIDASGVLQGQCSMVRATGETSQLNLRATGPYGVATLPALGREGAEGGSSAATLGGACQ